MSERLTDEQALDLYRKHFGETDEFYPEQLEQIAEDVRTVMESPNLETAKDGISHWCNPMEDALVLRGPDPCPDCARLRREIDGLMAAVYDREVERDAALARVAELETENGAYRDRCRILKEDRGHLRSRLAAQGAREVVIPVTVDDDDTTSIVLADEGGSIYNDIDITDAIKRGPLLLLPSDGGGEGEMTQATGKDTPPCP